MAETVSARRALLFVLAILFAAATLLYGATWIYYIRQPTRAELGMFLKYCIPSRRIEIVRLMEGGNVERAGLRPGDMILAINGTPLDTLSPYYDLVDRGRPRDVGFGAVEFQGAIETEERPHHRVEALFVGQECRDVKRQRAGSELAFLSC